MLDTKNLRSNLTESSQQLKRRGYTLDTETFEKLEARRKQLQVETQNLQSDRSFSKIPRYS